MHKPWHRSPRLSRRRWLRPSACRFRESPRSSAKGLHSIAEDNHLCLQQFRNVRAPSSRGHQLNQDCFLRSGRSRAPCRSLRRRRQPEKDPGARQMKTTTTAGKANMLLLLRCRGAKDPGLPDPMVIHLDPAPGKRGEKKAARAPSRRSPGRDGRSTTPARGLA